MMGMICRSASVLYLCIFLAFVVGCGKKEVKDAIKLPPIPEIEKLPVDYLFVVDNSGSIPPGDAREFAREAIKAFIELSEVNDKISIIVFDEDTRLVISRVITDRESKESVKRAEEESITFKGKHTDISSALSYVKAHKSELFRGRSFLPAVIFISDGRLELVPPLNIQDAYQNLIEDIQALSDMPFYTVGLGMRDIYDEFLPGVNGLALLKDQMAFMTGGRFYNIKSADELIETYLKILRFTKHISSMEGRYVFQVDESLKGISSIILKRTSTRSICATGDIIIKDPEGKVITYANHTAYRGPAVIGWQISKYYDIVVINNPTIGRWEIGLRSELAPEVMSLVKSLVNLRYMLRKSYWDKEKKQIVAWLYDERTRGISQIPCEVVAEVEKHEVHMTKTENEVHVAELPMLSKGDYLIRIRAENSKQFFYRMTDPIPFSVKESFFSFGFPKGSIPRRTVGWKGVKFNAIINTKAKNYIPFQAYPEVTLHIEKVDDEAHRHLLSKKLDKTVRGDKILHESYLTDLKLGLYTAYFEIKGMLTTGEDVDILSQSFSFKLKRPGGEYGGIVLATMIVIGTLIYLTRPKLRGSLQLAATAPAPPSAIINLKRLRKCDGKRKKFWGDYLNVAEHLNLSEISFRIHARRGKKKELKVDQGHILISNPPMGRKLTVNSGGSAMLYQGDKITFTDGKKDYEMTIY